MFSILDTNMSQKHYLGMASGVLNQLPFNEIIKIIPEQHHLDDPFNLYFSTYHPDSSETALIIMQSSPIQKMQKKWKYNLVCPHYTVTTFTN